ncbi:MAG: ABC transporter permease [Faecousia sp.]
MKQPTAQKRTSSPACSRVGYRLADCGRRAWKSRYLFLLMLPTLIWYVVFLYGPMYGLQIAFKDFVPSLGISGSKWVGFKHFISFFKSEYFVRVISNTLGISLYSIIVGFPVPIILALLMNEVGNKYFQKSVQTIAYLPHFISAVVVVSIINALLSPTSGLLNQVIVFFGGDPIHFMAEPKYFKTVFVLSDIWQSAGYNSIVYLAALTSIDSSMYEAATVDGASKWDKLIRITLPSLLPTIMIMLILRMGAVFSVGYEKIMLMYNEATYETADVISTYLYRRAFKSGDYSFSAAVGLFNSIVNFTVIQIFNKISAKISEVSLW